MSLKRDYKDKKKLDGGPGGWHCPCCNHYGCCARKMKPKARRLTRRTNKHNLKKDL